MQSTQLYPWITESFFKFLGTLPLERRKELLSKLSQSLSSSMPEGKNEFWESYGGWQGDESAEEIINSIRNSRHAIRSIEPI